MFNFFIYKNSLKTTNETIALEQWIAEAYQTKVHIRLIDKPVINAYATGVIPFSKLILLGKPVFEKMNQRDIQGLVLHELGHTVNHHLFILYCVNVICCGIGAFVYYYAIPIYKATSYTGLLIALHGALAYLIFVLAMPGCIQRRIEYAADRFAAKRIGAESYANTLTNLNILNNDGLNKWAVNYPSLKNRLRSLS